MSLADSLLFQPCESKAGRLANRIVMAPMTRSHSPGGVPGKEVAAYYRRRAEAGVGLIVTEGTTVDRPGASADARVPFIHGDSALAGWSHVVDEVHEAGGKIIPQLWHLGMTRRSGSGPNPEAPSEGPSGIFKEGVIAGEPMTQADIEATIAAFASAARSAMEIGFDGVEVHGAHGYLVDQFFWSVTNKRSDEYGGDIVGRTRFAADIVRAVREATSPDFMIVLRFSQWKQVDFGARLVETPEELEAFLAPLSEAGVDVFHASTRRFWEPEFEGSPLNLAGWTKKLTGQPTITVGSVGLDNEFIATFAGGEAGVTRIDDLIERVEAKEFDLVAVGRALMVDPNWVEKVVEERYDDIIPFSRENAARYY